MDGEKLMDDTDIRILEILANTQGYTLNTADINKQLQPPIDIEELQDRLEIMENTTRYITTDFPKHLGDIRIPRAASTASGRQFIRGRKK